MKKLILAFVLGSTLNAVAFPENLQYISMSTISYKQADECPLSYCKNNDDGFSMRHWCEAHLSKWGDNPFAVGWTKVNGFSCFCGCNNLW